MEQSASQNPVPGVQGLPMPANSVPDYMYPSADSHAHPPRQPQQQPQQPLGISWDHPIFAQQNPGQGHAAHQDQNHGIYTPAPQSWQSNPFAPPPGFGLPPQYQQVHHYPQGQVPFDSQSINPPDNSSLSSYPLSQNYYPSQQLPVQNPQLSQYQNTPQPPLPQFSTPIQLPAGYQEPSSNIPDHRTINPQFLSTPQSTTPQNPPLHNNFVYVNPADFERQDNGKRSSIYQQGMQPSSSLAQPGNSQFQQFQGVFVPAPQHIDLTGQPKQNLGVKGQFHADKAGPKITGKRPDASPISESASDDDSDLEVQEPDEPSPIPPTRPSDPMAAAGYDTLRAVWSPRNKQPHGLKVKNALVAFKDVVKGIRDAWKDSSKSMNAAENKGDNVTANKIKEDVVLRRRMMNVVLITALEKGHSKIVEKLGEHPMAVSALYSFLLDRHQASDVDGDLTVNILKLLARFTTADEDMLQKTNVAKILARLPKKAGQTVKALSQEILDNAAAATKRRQGQDTVRSPPKEESASKSPTPITASSENRPELAGSKRPREGESNGLPSTKRVLVTSQTRNGAKPANTVVSAAKRPQESGQDGKAATVASRPKANIVAPKPTNLFGTLSSASKRPGTSNAERAAAAAKSGNGGSPEKKEAPPAPKPTFSFGDVMADLNKAKSPAPAEPTENKPPETDEERERRLRKEHRRKLRVSWKPDHTLTEVRLFTHDPEEELGPGDRAAGDVKGEGKVLKLHRDLDELDDEEEGGIREETLLNYHPLVGIDLGDISPEDQARNFIKRAGSQEPNSAEKEAQNQRESNTLMVWYTSPADVPPSPKEPPPGDDEMARDEAAFGDLPDLVKARQERYRSASRPRPAPAPAPQPNAQNNQYDISTLLRAIQGAQQQQQPTPPPQPVSQAPMSDLERTVNMFRQQQQPAQLQVPQYPPAQAPAGQGFDLQRILGAINTQNQMQQPLAMPQPPSQPAVAPNVAAIVSQFANQGQQIGANQQQQSGPFHEDPERKRMREQADYDEPCEDHINAAKRAKQVGLTKHPKAGMVPCRYWREGRCVKGNECTFRHDPR